MTQKPPYATCPEVDPKECARLLKGSLPWLSGRLSEDEILAIGTILARGLTASMRISFEVAMKSFSEVMDEAEADFLKRMDGQ